MTNEDPYYFVTSKELKDSNTLWFSIGAGLGLMLGIIGTVGYIIVGI
jgi:hypothetical protein